MRLAGVVLVLISLVPVRAHADTMAMVGLPAPSVSVPFAQEIRIESSTMSAEVALPAAEGALLVTGQTNTAVTPEPASAVLLGSGLFGLGGVLWLRRRAARQGQRSAVA